MPESPGGLLQEAAPGLSSNPTRANGSGSSHNAPEGSHEGEGSQGRAVDGDGQKLTGELDLSPSLSETKMRPIEDKVGLPRLLIALGLAGYIGRSSYDRAYRAVVDGRIPAEPAPGTGNRWEVRRSDFPIAAAVLGLTPPAPQDLSQHIVASEQAPV